MSAYVVTRIRTADFDATVRIGTHLPRSGRGVGVGTDQTTVFITVVEDEFGGICPTKVIRYSAKHKCFRDFGKNLGRVF